MLFFSRYALPIALVVCVAIAAVASAESRLSVVGDGNVTMLSHRMNLQFGSQGFEVSETIVFANHGNVHAEALYQFELPARAAIVGLAVETSDGQKSDFAVVGAGASTRLVAETTGQHAPDMGLVRMIGSEGTGTRDRKLYELRVFPVVANRTTTITLQWNGIVNLVAGRHTLRFPSTGKSATLARTEVVVRTKTPMTELYGGSKLLSRHGQAKEFRFFAPATGDVVIQGKSASGNKHGPHAQVALVPISATSGVAVVRVSFPTIARREVPAIDRAIVIVDASTSMGAKGMEAAATVVDRLLHELGSATRVEVILFSRTSSRVLGDLRGASRNLRSQVLTEIRGAPQRNGSNLSAALALARTILESDRKADMRKTLISIVSDGVLPTTMNADEAADVLGKTAMTQANLLGVVLVPPNAPLPDVYRGPLGALGLLGRGRTVALRYQQVGATAHSVLHELGGSQPLESLDVELSTGDWVGATFDTALLPGESLTKLGFYQGKPPRRVVVKARRAGSEQRLVASKLPAKQARVLAVIAIANTSPFGMPKIATSAEQSHQALRDAAVKLGVVTQTSAGIALRHGDGFAADRLRSAQRWGMQTYRRLPPPAEKTAQGQNFAKFLPRRTRTPIEQGRTGELDAEMISRRIRAHVIPPVRRCYEKLLRKDRTAAGSLTLHIEVARGEVLHASIPILPPSLLPIRMCIEDAMYAMPMPQVRQGLAAQSITIARYPLRFQMAQSGRKGSVKQRSPNSDPRSNDPLEGLPE